MSKRFLLCVLLAVPVAARAAVTTDTVASVTVSTSNFMNANIALDAGNNVHMVFVDSGTQILKYAKLANGTASWTVSDVSAHKVAPQCDLALSPSGTPHVVYYQTDAPAGVKHAKLVGGSWSEDSVEVFDGTNTFVSIAVGTDNYPRVVYNHSVSSTTKYGEYSAVGVTTQTAVVWTGGPCALALGADNTPYFLTVNDFLGSRYDSFVKRNSSGTFSWVEFVSTGVLNPIMGSQKVGLAIDQAGKAHVSFFDESRGGLIYGSVVGGSTTTLVLDTTTGAGYSSDIAFNDQNQPMIVYFSSGIGLRSAVFNNSWTLSTLEPGSLNGVGPSVVFNRHRHCLAGYLDGDSNQVKFMTDAFRDLSISGTVLDFNGSPIPGVGLTISGGITPTVLAVSASTGGYSADHLFEGSYTLVPSKAGYAFQPTSLSFNPLQVSRTFQNIQGGLVDFATVGNLFNPARGEQVTFNYSTIPGQVSLKVYNLRGMPIQTLVDQDQAAGDHSVTWDGRDTDGNVVASGIYLVQFEANQTKSSKKVAVVK